MAEANQDEITLRDIVLSVQGALRYLKTKWLFLLLAGLLGSVLGYLHAKFKPLTHTATLVFAFSESPDAKSSLSGIASQFGVNLGGGGEGAFQGDNLLELMKSRTLVEKALMQQAEVGGKTDFLVNHIIRHEYKRGETKEERQHDVLFKDSNRFFLGDSFLGVYHRAILENNQLAVSKKDDELAFVEVSFTSQNDTVSKVFVEGLVYQATELYRELKMKRFSSTVQLLDKKIDSVEVELRKSMYSVAAQEDQGSLYIRSTPQVGQVRSQYKAQVLGTMHAELVKNAELQKTLMAQQEPLFEIIDRPVYPLETKRLSRLLALVLGGFGGVFVLMLILLGKRGYSNMMWKG